MKALHCDRCDRLMTDPETGASFIGVAYTPPTDEAFVRVYPELTGHAVVNICAVCWLASMGVRPTIELP